MKGRSLSICPLGNFVGIRDNYIKEIFCGLEPAVGSFRVARNSPGHARRQYDAQEHSSEPGFGTVLQWCANPVVRLHIQCEVIQVEIASVIQDLGPLPLMTKGHTYLL
jgi:hypothetical protein